MEFVLYYMKNTKEYFNNIELGKIERVYVCSPVKGDQDDPMVIKDNISRAVLYSRDVYHNGFLPICPHIYLEDATELNESNNPGDREIAIRLGLELLTACQRLWVYGRRRGEESTGMKDEIEFARKMNIPVTYRDIYAPKI